MKLEALTAGVLQSAFNNFAKYTVKHLCWSLFLIKWQAWWCTTFSRKKTPGQMFFCTFSEIYKKNMPKRVLEWNEPKNLFTKSIHRQTPVMASFLVQFQVCRLTVFPKRNSITDVFLWKMESFTEHQFYRAVLRDCF